MRRSFPEPAYRFTANVINVAQRDCRTPKFSRYRLREVLEEVLAAPEDDWRDDDVELVDNPGVEALSDHVAPPPMLTALSPAAAVARSIASSKAPTKLNSLSSGSSSGRWVTTKTGMPNGFLPPQ